MGAILGRFRTSQTGNIRIVERLDEEIEEIERYTISIPATEKRYVKYLFLISIPLYILYLVSYFTFLPRTWTYLVPLFIFPFIIILFKCFVTLIFQRKLKKKLVKLSKLKDEKKEHLQKLMGTEAYQYVFLQERC